ncbi:hypothetical protein BASA81_010017 [Batrachochytrium salamandrivorans]|nr:hypothetical protein BASA81_010017 [Batrachochytrium salamandrivorans]
MVGMGTSNVHELVEPDWLVASVAVPFCLTPPHAVFNRKLGKHDEDSSLLERAESILYFYPPDAALAGRVEVMELVCTFLDVSKLFGSDSDGGDWADPVHEICLEDCHYGVAQVEPDVFFCMGISAQKPVALPQASAEDGDLGVAMRMYRTLVPGSPRNNGTGEWTRPHKDAMRAVLGQIYAHLVVLSGPFANHNSDTFKQYLERMIPTWLGHHQSPHGVNLGVLHCSALVCLQGMEHLPIDRTTFLSVQGFVHQANTEWFANQQQQLPKLVMFGSQMVWSSMPNTEAWEMFSFVQQQLRITNNEGMMDDGYLPVGKSYFPPTSAVAVAAVDGLKIYFPRIYLSSSRRWLRMAVLKVKRTMLVVVLATNTDLDLQEADLQLQLQRFKHATTGELAKVNALLEEAYKRIAEDQTPTTAFLYSNQTNRVLKSSPRFQQWAKSPVLSEATLPFPVLRALHHVWFGLFVRKCEMLMMVCGEWGVTGWRSGKRMVFRFSSAARTADSPFLLLTGLEQDLEKLLQGKFSNVVMF